MKKLLLIIIFLLCCVIYVHAQKFENLALTPPMGWNSWNNFGCNVNESIIKEMADAMVECGMHKAGYQYIVIDDCWQIERDEKGNILADPERFPSGIKALADYIHAKGLKFGIYSDAGTNTCQGRPGSRGYEYQDARTYAGWGVDYLKYDWCNTGTQDAQASYKTMRNALYSAGRPIVFSICEWGKNEPWKWAGDIGHLWRTTADIQPCFDCTYGWGGLGVMQILDQQVSIRKYHGPGHWNDPDMLEVGNEGLTINESRAHFSLWCMLAAPLMAGNDLRNMKPEITAILSNSEVIKVNQDSLGIAAFRYIDYGDIEIWFKPLNNGDFAFCFLNRGDQAEQFEFKWPKRIYDSDFGWKSYKISDNMVIKDLWNHKIIGRTKNPINAVIPSHDVLMVRLSDLK